jgi:NifB/MoaA-like Fe-S oxidoreductase
VLADLEVPSTEFYGEFEQLEDGIGMIRLFRNNIENTLPELKVKAHGSFTMVTASSAFKEIESAAKSIKAANNNININAVKIMNEFFGETITVAGLLTGKDIINQLKNLNLGEYIIIPRNMLRSGEEVFLDDVTIKDMETALNRKVVVCDYSGEDLIDIINRYTKED